MKKILLYATIFAVVVLISGCQPDKHDYQYIVVNNAEKYSPVTIRYLAKDDTAKTIILNLGDEAILAEREGVTGDEVWDIETSYSLYKIKSISIFSNDSSHTSDNALDRKAWTGPENRNGIGVYKLNITDESLMVFRQNGYVYKLNSELADTLRISFTINEKKDTVIVGRQSIVLDSTTIYAYPEEYRSWNDYKMKKISGLSSLVVWHNSNISPKKFNLSKDTSCFDTQKDTCYITITQEMIE